MMSDEWKASDLVYRQVHPSHAPEGVPSSQAFNPTPKDEGQLSVDDSRVFTAEESWDHFTRNLGFQSAGTWAVSIEEVETAGGLVLLILLSWIGFWSFQSRFVVFSPVDVALAGGVAFLDLRM